MRNFLFSIPALLCAAPLAAQSAPTATMQQRAEELVPIINGQGDVAQSFGPSFLAAIPEADLRALGTQLVEQLGNARSIAKLDQVGPSKATLNIIFERGRATAELVVAPSGARQIIGFRIIGTQADTVASLRTLEEVSKAIATLPGRTAFIVSDLEASKPVVAVAADEPIGIGSTFKLVILAEIVRAIEAGERGWDDLMPIDGTELPAGIFRDLPKGSQIPLRGLAEAMIRTSDNSATDILIRYLGREQVEAMQARLGMQQPNAPFLTTLEAFKLKGAQGGALGQRYLALDAAGRRRMLEGEVARLPASEIGPLFADDRPVMIDSVEWFASPADLVRMMAWFEDRRESRTGAEALRIMALNPGPASDLVERYDYIGYKGGSEPGLLSMTLLLRDKAGNRVSVISASWTDPAGPVDELRFSSLLRRAAELLLDRR